jgi:PhzF family phenazine biosynthesis protein
LCKHATRLIAEWKTDMGIPVYQVDAFTSQPFAGNPAAVVFLDRPAEADWMQAVAAEMALSETAFLCPAAGGWNLRWFTPKVEVKLCGHATLASAHVLWGTGRLAGDRQAVFHTQSGQLICTKRGEWIDMDFPAHPCREAEPPDGLAGALGARPVAVFRVGGATGWTWLVELENEAVVRDLRVDFGKLLAVPLGSAIVTARATTEGFDFVSRFFAPVAGINEDPVTGSSHCSLGPYWGQKLGKGDLTALQVSRRGGVVKVRVADDRVTLAGQAITVLCGELACDACP